MPNLPIFDGKVPPGERGDGCLEPRVPTSTDVVPVMSPNWLLSDDDIDTRCRAFKPIVDRRLEQLRPIQIYQYKQSSCTSSAAGNGTSLCNLGEAEEVKRPSQANLYAFEWIDEKGNVTYRTRDNGQALVVAVRALQLFGIASAEDIDPFDWRRKAWPDNWKKRASPNKLLEVKQLHSLQAMKSAIARPAAAILCGYSGHARVAVWRNPDTGIWTLPNSWQSQPIHHLDDGQMEKGRQRYEAFAFFVTVAR